jgi:uncharacterized protein
MIVVSDTSGITSLLQVGQEALLKELYGEVLIPETVQEELLQTHPLLPAFVRSERVLNIAEVQRLGTELDWGEAEAIALAKERRADLLLMDELDGRRVALREGVPFIGLLGVIVQAKQIGLVPSVRQLISELEAVADFRLSDEIKAVAFRKAGEF